MNNNSPKFTSLLMKGMVARKNCQYCNSIETNQNNTGTLFFFLYILHLTQEGFIILLVNEPLHFPPGNVGQLFISND